MDLKKKTLAMSLKVHILFKVVTSELTLSCHFAD